MLRTSPEASFGQDSLSKHRGHRPRGRPQREVFGIVPLGEGGSPPHLASSGDDPYGVEPIALTRHRHQDPGFGLRDESDHLPVELPDSKECIQMLLGWDHPGDAPANR